MCFILKHFFRLESSAPISRIITRSIYSHQCRDTTSYKDLPHFNFNFKGLGFREWYWGEFRVNVILRDP